MHALESIIPKKQGSVHRNIQFTFIQRDSKHNKHKRHKSIF